jgi:hypothetical protein
LEALDRGCLGEDCNIALHIGAADGGPGWGLELIGFVGTETSSPSDGQPDWPGESSHALVSGVKAIANEIKQQCFDDGIHGDGFRQWIVEMKPAVAGPATVQLLTKESPIEGSADGARFGHSGHARTFAARLGALPQPRSDLPHELLHIERPSSPGPPPPPSWGPFYRALLPPLISQLSETSHAKSGGRQNRRNIWSEAVSDGVASLGALLRGPFHTSADGPL